MSDRKKYGCQEQSRLRVVGWPLKGPLVLLLAEVVGLVHFLLDHHTALGGAKHQAVWGDPGLDAKV